jgi:hypothetical protein
MSYRAIAAFPVVYTLAVVALVGVVAPESRPDALQGAVDVAKVLALIGLARAALAFEPDEYLRRGWGLFAVCYVFLLARDAALLIHAAPVAVQLVRAIFVTIANFSLVLGVWTLARAWTVAGLEFPGTRGARIAITGAAIVAAIALAGPELFIDVSDTITGRHPGYASIGSDLGDMLALPLIAPVALTAFAVREGTLRWPWSLLTSSLFAWLAYDTFATIPELVVVPRPLFHTLGELAHVLAITLACAAGLAQRRAVTDDGPATH